MSLRGFATLNFFADDVAAAAEWYERFLGVAPYYRVPGPDGRPAYVEFRIGDLGAELGLIEPGIRLPLVPLDELHYEEVRAALRAAHLID